MSRRSDRQEAIRASLLEMEPYEKASHCSDDEYGIDSVEIELECAAYQQASFIKVQLKSYGGTPESWLFGQPKSIWTTYVYDALSDLWEADSI